LSARLQEQGVHGSLEADMQLADLPFGQGYDSDVGEAHAFEEASGVLLVTTNAIEGFRVDKIELPSDSVLQERLDPRPKERRAGNGTVTIDFHQLVAVSLNTLTTKANLVVDARGTL
jgi:hypothetical protein